MIQIAMHGAGGRMGQSILRCIFKDPDTQISGAVDRSNHPYIGKDIGEPLGVEPIKVNYTSSLDSIDSKTQVMIDFSSPGQIETLLNYAKHQKFHLVIGTTGFNKDQEQWIRNASQEIAIVWAPNMSIGVNVLFELAKKTTQLLGEGYDIEIVESHHHHKKDAPSGTAMQLLKEIQNEKNRSGVATTAIYGREGQVGERKRDEIGVFALRGGDIVGDHTVYFVGDGERIELTHRAHTRDTFAWGAVKAAKFLANKESGLYTMKHVLGLEAL